MGKPEHTKLLAYQRAIESIVLVEDVTRELPYDRDYLRRQLRRSAASTALNIAEGAGEFSPAEKARFYRIALRSCTESQSVLDVIEAAGLPCASAVPARAKLEETAALTTRLARSVERRD